MIGIANTIMINRKLQSRIARCKVFTCDVNKETKNDSQNVQIEKMAANKCVQIGSKNAKTSNKSIYEKPRKAIRKKINRPDDQKDCSKFNKKNSKKGLPILPRNVEAKIYRFKKALQNKNVDPEEIRTSIRKKRRQEELKYRKSLRHLCFKCRKPGHSMANCPNQSDENNEESVDICYFCGSIDHKLSECCTYKKRIQENGPNAKIDLPFVKCFICNEKGHLTRNCSQNKNGAFPNGGKCRRCGSINHTLKECLSKIANNDELEISLQTYDNLSHGIDVDDAIIPNLHKNEKKSSKIVKF